MKRIKIMFVCHGNICRSPSAEFIMKKMVKEKNLENSFEISSCATSTEEIYNGVGNPVYPPMKQVLEIHGINCDGKMAVQLQKSDYDKYDYFVAMDSNNVRNIHRIFGGDVQEKISKLMQYTGENRDVSDPWYTRDFEGAYDDIYRGCKALLNKLI